MASTSSGDGYSEADEERMLRQLEGSVMSYVEILDEVEPPDSFFHSESSL